MADESSRPSWDEYFMGITLEVARRSTCNRAQVSAIAVTIPTTWPAPSARPHWDWRSFWKRQGWC